MGSHASLAFPGVEANMVGYVYICGKVCLRRLSSTV